MIFLFPVLMDYPHDRNADTGDFELVYNQTLPENQPYLGPCLFAFGKSMTLNEPTSAIRRKYRDYYTNCNQWQKNYRNTNSKDTKDSIDCFNNNNVESGYSNHYQEDEVDSRC